MTNQRKSSKHRASSEVIKSDDASEEQRRQCVSVAAYYIAERRGFQGGTEVEDWLRAEKEIGLLVKEGKLVSFD